MRVKPFRAVRPKRELAEKVACPPYDVVSEDDVLRLTKGNPYSFLHVVRAEVAQKPRLDSSDPTVHVRARDTLNRFLNEGILIQDDSSRFYVYAQQMGAHRQVGLVACASVEEYLEGKIKKHELTRQDKEDDRTRHVLTVGANTGPVFLMYRSIPELDTLIVMSTKELPEYDFVDENGVRHTVWMVTDDGLIRKIEDWFSRRVKEFYIADGHHRAAAAARACQKLKAENPHHTGDEEYNFFLSVIFPHNQLMILPYNRVVRDLNDLSVHEFLEKASARFKVEKLDVKTFEPQQRHVFGMYMKEKWYRLEPREGSFDPSDPVDSLDVQILLKNLLQPVLGIENPRKDPRIDFVGGIKGVEHLKELVDSGKYSLAFSLYPTQIEDLMRVADAGMIMPPKSTWFEPKLRSGVFVHRIE